VDLDVAGSIPVTRPNLFKDLGANTLSKIRDIRALGFHLGAIVTPSPGKKPETIAQPGKLSWGFGRQGPEVQILSLRPIIQ
jgi:hypothetical protein